ncbi:hypothetical protein CDL12_23952 [Handroanthus impetiginosus]|uniref:TFIIS N-terminal domain-containing protein n=1 Tax=Handroanthus impetiginosus TaxID=429701 RepID=A0A2G9FXC0_9LAMI|nr:hypothetical protein CDL12_29822 [Handroanthus impetiginosus]PIN03530.1 hypothetical protein CDL12_23952 [Handroanthus impetiginosus]
MALDDFFTLTEMNNGLTVPSRVKELMAVMQKERDGIVKNVGEATRQWSAVGSAIAATENQDCLDLFIQLDGLHFIAKWLKDAQKFSNDSSDTFVEESITHLLQALEKLQVDYEKLVATEIWTTVKDLLAHNSSKVQDKAQALFASWKRKGDSDASLSHVEKFGALTDNEVGKGADIGRGSGHSDSSQRDDSLSIVISCKESGQELTRDDPVLSTSSDAVHSGQVEKTHHADKTSKPAVGDDKLLDHAASPSLPKPATGLPACDSIGGPSLESCNPAVSRQDILDGQTEFQELESARDRMHAAKMENSPEKLRSHEELNTSEDRPVPSSSDAAYAKKSVTESGSHKFSVTGDKSLCDEGSSYIDSGKVDSSGKGSMDDSCSATQKRSSSAFTAEEGSEYRVLCKSSSDEKSWENSKELGALSSGIEDHEKIKKLDLSGNNLANDRNFAKKGARREPDRARKKSDVELYGIVDPLEVALQVARQVVDYREQSCSSSDKLPEGNAQQPDSPNSVSGKQSHASEGSPKDVANDPDLSDEASPMQEESATSNENLDADKTNDVQTMDTSPVTEGHQEEAPTEKCSFDLNQEVSAEEDDCSRDQFLTTVSVVSASRAAAAPGQPVAPLQFEGNLGWKGSAATSAFRPASPRRMPESEKDLSAGGSGSSSKQRQGCLDIDLNVAESIDDRTGDLSSDKNVPSYFGLPSGESSGETNPRKSEPLQLDLNRTSEDGAFPSDLRMGQFFPQGNGHHTRSHSSSSSSKQPSLMNINLNDQPSFLNDSADNSYLGKLSQNFSVSGVNKSDDSAISIMGTRVEVNRKDFVSPSLALPNGRTSGLPFDVNVGRTGSFLGIGSVLPYAHSSVYGYNTIASGPAMPFSSTIYGSGGPIPYMVDSRGAPVIPQIVGSASALPTGFSQPPFFINMTNPTPNGVGAVGPSRSSFDLNTVTMVDGGSRDPASFAQFPNSGQLRLMDEQLRSNSQPTISSVAGGKRKEPDNGWEHYPFKHYTPPWK